MTTLTPDQEAWLRDRIAAIEAADARRNAAGLAALKQLQAERDRAGVLAPQSDDDAPGGSCLAPLVVVIGIPVWMVVIYVVLVMVGR